MEKLGGHALYSDLYSKIEDMKLKDTNAVVDFKAQVRGTIERFSSDSEVYHNTNSNRDLFYLVG